MLLNLRLFLILIVFLMGEAAHAGTSGDVKHVYQNPLTKMKLNDDCFICADFYRVTKFHQFIGVRLEVQCGERKLIRDLAYGMSVVDHDNHLFSEILSKNPKNSNLEFIDRFCGDDAKLKLQLATDMSNDHLEGYKRSQIITFFRFVITPLARRPCRNIAVKIQEKLQE